MAKYKVLKKCFLAVRGSNESRQYSPGEIIDYDGPPAAYLEPIGDSEAHLRWKDAFPHAPRTLPVGL